VTYRRMARNALAFLAVLIVASATRLAAQAPTAADSVAVRAAAKNWIAMVDHGDYVASWNAASQELKSAVDTAGWKNALQQARGTFDPLSKRTEAQLHFVTNPPGSPPGEYAMEEYHAKARTGSDVTERVVLIKSGGSWLVAGYFIKPGLL
jgi:hypothetical protein